MYLLQLYGSGKLPGEVPAPSLPAGIQNLSPIKCLIGIIGLLTDAHGEEVLERVAKIQYRRASSFKLCYKKHSLYTCSIPSS